MMGGCVCLACLLQPWGPDHDYTRHLGTVSPPGGFASGLGEAQLMPRLCSFNQLSSAHARFSNMIECLRCITIAGDTVS